MKNKSTAGVFALLFGAFGLHRFYLGQRKLGIFYMVATVCLFIISVTAEAPIVMIMGIIAFIDAVLLFSVDQEEFNEKYNQRFLNRPHHIAVAAPRQKLKKAATTAEAVNPWKAAGLEKFKDFDYDGALEDFKKSLELKFDDPAVHFNLACCYSLNERTDPAFFHLTKAVHSGFVDFDKIEQHHSLAYLRTQAAFQDFVKKGYQRFTAAPMENQTLENEPDLLAQTPTASRVEYQPSLLDQIKRLSDLRERGILTEDEYKGMKAEVLRG